MTTTVITQAEFEAIRSSAAAVEEEKDNPYATETFYDADDRQIAEAYYSNWDAPKFVRFDPPMPRAQYDEDGNQIAVEA